MDLKSRNELKELKKTLRNKVLADRKALYDNTPEVFAQYNTRIIETLKQTEDIRMPVLSCALSPSKTKWKLIS